MIFMKPVLIPKPYHMLMIQIWKVLCVCLATQDLPKTRKWRNYQRILVISNEIKSILEWLNINKLSLNVKKTKFMLFHYHQCNVNSLIPKLAINSEPIERVTECNFLGLTIDGHLSWPPHIQKISNKISRTIKIMCQLRFLPTHILKLIYTSYFADFRNCKKEQFIQ